MNKPTPRPWQVKESRSGTDRPILCIERAIPPKDGINGLIAVLPDRCPSASQWKANAAHIVECVNLHDELVRLLRECERLFHLLGGVPILIRSDLTKMLAKAEGRDE